jgi:hypothetical protein
MTQSTISEPGGRRGSKATGRQEPRIEHLPPGAVPAGREAVELAAYAGLVLDPWQAYVLMRALAERPGGKWAAFEVGINVARQNGKNSILEARELAGLFLLDERLLIHSAHQFDTSLEAFRRLLELVESRDEFTKRVKRVSRSHGEEGIELYGPSGRRTTGGQRIRFRTRTKGGGRGFSSDFLAYDEAMILSEASHGATLPTLSARPNPQVWYAGSAVDRLVHEDGLVFARVRDRALRGDDEGLAYFEWSCAHDDPADVPDEILMDEAMWAEANPSLGIRISTEHVMRELRSMDSRTFAVERLGVGAWPSLDGGDTVIDVAKWLDRLDRRSKASGSVCFAFDVSPNRERAAIGVAGTRPDGLGHLEVVDHRRGTSWVVDRLVRLGNDHSPLAIICDKASPAASLVPELTKRGVEVELVSSADQASACGLLFDAVEQGRVRHIGQGELTAAIRGAGKRPLGDAWAWSRKASGVDISPLVAVTLAWWGLATALEQEDDIGAIIVGPRKETK